MTVKNLVKDVNRLYKLLEKADKGGEAFDKVAYRQLKSLISAKGKRTFNMRGLTVDERQIFRDAGEKFLHSKGSTLEGAMDTRRLKVENFNNQLRAAYGYIPENRELYEAAFRALKADGAYEEEGTSPPFDFIVEEVNSIMAAYNNKIDDIQTLTDAVISSWRGEHPYPERESAYEEVAAVYGTPGRDVNL